MRWYDNFQQPNYLLDDKNTQIELVELHIIHHKVDSSEIQQSDKGFFESMIGLIIEFFKSLGLIFTAEFWYLNCDESNHVDQINSPQD